MDLAVPARPFPLWRLQSGPDPARHRSTQIVWKLPESFSSQMMSSILCMTNVWKWILINWLILNWKFDLKWNLVMRQHSLIQNLEQFSVSYREFFFCKIGITLKQVQTGLYRSCFSHTFGWYVIEIIGKINLNFIWRISIIKWIFGKFFFCQFWFPLVWFSLVKVKSGWVLFGLVNPKTNKQIK